MYPERWLTPAQLYASVYAFGNGELTLNEFRSALHQLQPEALQVVATILGCRAAVLPEPSPRLQMGRELCANLAAATRSLC